MGVIKCLDGTPYPAASAEQKSMFMKTGVIRPRYTNHAKKNALRSGMRNLVKGAAQPCASIEIGIIYLDTANPVKRNARRSGRKNAVPTAAQS